VSLFTTPCQKHKGNSHPPAEPEATHPPPSRFYGVSFSPNRSMMAGGLERGPGLDPFALPQDHLVWCLDAMQFFRIQNIHIRACEWPPAGVPPAPCLAFRPHQLPGTTLLLCGMTAVFLGGASTTFFPKHSSPQLPKAVRRHHNCGQRGSFFLNTAFLFFSYDWASAACFHVVKKGPPCVASCRTLSMGRLSSLHSNYAPFLNAFP